MEHGPPRRRRARPVADAPIDGLLVAAEDLAKGWLLALLEQAPLAQAPGILAVDLARDGPRICDACVRALADDADLRRIEPGGPLEPLVARTAQIAGAEDAEATVRAVDALQAVIWSALRSEMPWPDPGQIADLAERLALVSERVREAALRRPAQTGDVDAPEERRRPGEAQAAEGRATPALRISRISEPEPPARAEAVTPPPGAQGESPAPSGSPQARSEPVVDPLWVGAIEDEIRQSERSGAPLALLLAELDEADRVRAAEPARESSATFGRFAQAVRSVVRREDLLACETDTRAWIIARETSRGGAYALATRIVRAVKGGPPLHGAPMTVSVGLAVFGEDGRDAASLIDAAEEAKFAAAASGVRIIREDQGEPPAAG